MNNSAVIPFQFQSTTVRTVIRNEEPWFVAKDICEALGIANVGNATARIPEKDRMTIRPADSHSGQRGGAQSLAIISEAGLYRLVLRSDKPEAEPFIDWVTSEVLPTLRKTGKYDMSQARYNTLEADKDAGILAYQFDGMCRLAKMFGLEGNQALLKADKAVRKLHGTSPIALLEIELKTPGNEALIIPSEMGRLLNPPISAKSLNRALAAMGLQEKREYKPKAFEWRLTDKGKAFGAYFDVGRKHSDGTPVLQIKWRESVAGLVEEHLNN